MRILVTGTAGFIGAATSLALLRRGDEVMGVDDLNSSYDVRLKEDRLELLTSHPGFRFVRLDIADRVGMARLFSEYRPERVVHLAARAGVRHSLSDPHAYIETNVMGFLNVLEGCRACKAEHIVYASSSSVYGANRKLPFSAEDRTDQPVSLYAATKRSNELMAHSYSHLFGLACTGLRFFNVFGPWGRPDTAFHKFTRNILAGEPIELFNHGEHRRDFTYIDDIVEGVVRALDRPAPPLEGVAHRLYNIGSDAPVGLTELVTMLEELLGRKARVKRVGFQPGDIRDSHADVESFARDFGFRPATPFREGLERFVAWYRDYYERASLRKAPETGAALPAQAL